MLTLSSVTTPEPENATTEADSNEPTIPYGFGVQHPTVSPSPKDLNLPPHPFNILATMAVIQAESTQRDEGYSPNHRSRQACRLF